MQNEFIATVFAKNIPPRCGGFIDMYDRGVFTDIYMTEGYSAFHIFSTADAVPEKIVHSRLHGRFLRCKNRRYGEPNLLCKLGSIIPQGAS